MYSEIGSEFWNNCCDNTGIGIAEYIPFERNAIYTLSGRTALDLIVKDIKSKNENPLSVYMPAYCCHSMIQPFTDNGVDVKFYDVAFANGRFTLDISDEDDSDIFFAMEYFGYHIDGFIGVLKDQKAKGKTIIQDMTHSLFEKADESADYYFASLRKWFNVNAGYASKKENWNIKAELKEDIGFSDVRNKAFQLKESFIKNNDIEKSSFLDAFGKAEEWLDEQYAEFKPDERSLEILHTLDSDSLKKRRRANAELLIKEFSMEKYRSFFETVEELNDGETPLFVPIIVKKGRDELRKYLINNNIYLPVHWSKGDMAGVPNGAKRLYESELSVVCDQRYGLDDMKRIIDCIKGYFEL